MQFEFRTNFGRMQFGSTITYFGPLEAISPQIGDIIIIEFPDNQRSSFRVTSLSDDELVVEDNDGTSWSLQYQSSGKSGNFYTSSWTVSSNAEV